MDLNFFKIMGKFSKAPSPIFNSNLSCGIDIDPHTSEQACSLLNRMRKAFILWTGYSITARGGCLAPFPQAAASIHYQRQDGL